jgi:hypothetical protein
MLPILLMMMTTIGGFSYKVALSERAKPVASAPPGYPATWKEHVEVISGTDPRDAAFFRFMRRQAKELREDYYRGDVADGHGSFETYDNAGWLDVSERVIAASPDLVSVATEETSYGAGRPHPDHEDGNYFIWSRRLHRLLKQDDVLGVPPDRALRRLALSRYDNREGLEKPDDPDGIPLAWDHATIGPAGIIWSFGPYELGGYLAGGHATIPWSALRPYLRRHRPFVIEAIRAAPERFRGPRAVPRASR